MIKRGNLLVPINPPKSRFRQKPNKKIQIVTSFLFQTRVRHFEGVDTFSKSPKSWSNNYPLAFSIFKALTAAVSFSISFLSCKISAEPARGAFFSSASRPTKKDASVAVI